jgi:hypothetical protein
MKKRGYYFPTNDFRLSDKAVAGQFNLFVTLLPEPSEETMKYYLVELLETAEKVPLVRCKKGILKNPNT